MNYDDWKTTEPEDRYTMPEPKPRPTFSLRDDGTLDTVFQCDQCGEEFRFHFDEHDPDCAVTLYHSVDHYYYVYTEPKCDRDCYDEFVAQCMADCQTDHDCTGEDW